MFLVSSEGFPKDLSQLDYARWIGCGGFEACSFCLLLYFQGFVLVTANFHGLARRHEWVRFWCRAAKGTPHRNAADEESLVFF